MIWFILGATVGALAAWNLVPQPAVLKRLWDVVKEKITG